MRNSECGIIVSHSVGRILIVRKIKGCDNYAAICFMIVGEADTEILHSEFRTSISPAYFFFI